MSLFKDKTKIISYPPETLRSFEVYRYEWIDNLNFAIPPEDCLDNANDYIEVAKELFLQAGWQGDGKIELIWIPPFMMKTESADHYNGVTVWHVKQLEDGTSWLLSPMQIPYGDYIST